MAEPGGLPCARAVAGWTVCVRQRLLPSHRQCIMREEDGVRTILSGHDSVCHTGHSVQVWDDNRVLAVGERVVRLGREWVYLVAA